METQREEDLLPTGPHRITRIQLIYLTPSRPLFVCLRRPDMPVIAGETRAALDLFHSTCIVSVLLAGVKEVEMGLHSDLSLTQPSSLFCVFFLSFFFRSPTLDLALLSGL